MMNFPFRASSFPLTPASPLQQRSLSPVARLVFVALPTLADYGHTPEIPGYVMFNKFRFSYFNIMKKLCALFLFGSAFLPTTVFGQLAPDPSRYPIDSAYAACLEVPDNQSTYGMIDCATKAWDAWDKELNNYYKLLLPLLSPDEKEKLRTAQRNWLAYRDSELTFYGTMYGNMQGTMWRVVAAERSMDIVRQRALELRAYYEILTEEK